ncbi:MAG: pknA3 [Frankiales bacterium]|nr:pknA3 [Frankiales bacterium]
MAQLHANALLSDRYRVRALLAMGGMAEVWVADDTLLDRSVAVKVLRAAMAEDSSAADRLRAEARLAAKVRSEHVVHVHDVGEVVDGDGRRSPYLVMELVEGETLRDQMLRGPLDPERVRTFVTQIAQALSEAHALGVIHRDIKPANVLVTPSGDCKLTDFGISCSAENAAITATGLVMGTARYLSPEQVSGARASEASDIYSLGVVAHEALRGQPVFSTYSDVEAALAHVQQQPPPLPVTVPSELADLVFRMLAKDPRDRPTATAIASGHVPALPRQPSAVPSQAGAVLADAPVTPTRAIPLVTHRTPRRPKALLAATLAGLLVIGTAAATTRGSHATPAQLVDSSPAVAPTASAAPSPRRSAPAVRPVARTAPVTRSAHTAAPVAHPKRSHAKAKGKHH